MRGKFFTNTIMKKQTGLSKVQTLYVLQVELWKLLDGDLSDKEKKQEAQKYYKDFSKLLSEVDWEYMGGQDVYDSLKLMKDEAGRKLQTKQVKKAGGTKKKVASAKKKAKK